VFAWGGPERNLMYLSDAFMDREQLVYAPYAIVFCEPHYYERGST
jgi:hypothetical protein